MTPLKSILIIDDERTLRLSIAAMLERKGYRVFKAGNAQEARQWLKEGPFDLVLLDLKMPDTDGMVLLPEICKQYPEMPVVVLSAYATLESVMEAAREGAQDYLLKPIDPARFLQRIEETLSQPRQIGQRRHIISHIEDLLGEQHKVEDSDKTP
jgi:two-component system response regulator HydG